MECFNSYQNQEYACFFFIIWKIFSFQMVSWIFYSEFQTVDVQNATLSSNDLWPINMSQKLLLGVSTKKTRILQKLVKI